MNKKYLVVSGDSFTEGHTMGEQASWAYWVAKKMNLELINLSCGGKGNEWISNNLLSFLTSTDISLDECIVMVGWSDLSRQILFLDLEIGDEPPGLVDLVIGDLLYPSESLENDLKLKYVYNNRKVLHPIFSSITWCLFKTYQSILYTKLFLENNNIPFLFFDVLTDNKVYYKNGIPYIKKSYLHFLNENLEEIPFIDEVISSMISEKNVKNIFNQNYINFQNKTILGWLKLDGNFKYEKGNEGHTNIEGAEKISEYIIDNFKKIYK